MSGVDDSPFVSNDRPRAYPVDPDRATKLWAISEKLVGETFDF